MYSTGMLLWLLVTVCSAVVNEETSRFLNGNGFENLEPRFLDEEIEVRHIPGLPDNLLVDLGVRTIGARLRIRSAATQWLEAQVFVCFVNLLNFVSFLCLLLPILCSSKVREEQLMAQVEMQLRSREQREVEKMGELLIEVSEWIRFMSLWLTRMMRSFLPKKLS